MQKHFRLGVGIGSALLWAAALGVGVGCGSPPAVAPAPEPPLSKPGFSGARALELARSLGALGERPVGSEAVRDARGNLQAALAGLGLEVEELTPEDPAASEADLSPLTHLLARVPGEVSQDAFLLVAPYAGAWVAPPAGTCDAQTHTASGAGVLVEIARALAANPLPYGVWLAFVQEPGEPEDRESEPNQLPGRGVSGLGLVLQNNEEIERVRLAVFFSGSAERDLVVARDLYSHRTFRERFFRTASRLGYDRVFPSHAPFASPLTGHRIFLASGFRSVLAIAPEPPAPETLAEEPSDEPGQEGQEEQEEPQEPDSAAELEACSAESLQAVGEVTIAALAEISDLLLKVDRFVRRGEVAAEEPTEELPEPGVESPDPTLQPPTPQPERSGPESDESF